MAVVPGVLLDHVAGSAAWPGRSPRRDEGQVGPGSRVDELPYRLGVEVLLDEVPEQVESAPAGRGEVRVRRHQEAVPAGLFGHAGEEAPAELVGFEGAMPVGAIDVLLRSSFRPAVGVHADDVGLGRLVEQDRVLADEALVAEDHTVVAAGVHATGRNGIVEVTIPKQPKAQPRRIQVATA